MAEEQDTSIEDEQLRRDFSEWSFNSYNSAGFISGAVPVMTAETARRLGVVNSGSRLIGTSFSYGNWHCRVRVVG